MRTLGNGWWRRFGVLLVVLLVLGSVPGVAAAQADSVTRTGGTVTVAEGETIEGNLVATGGTVVIDGRVTGDATVTAGTVIVSETGRVEGDLDAMAGSVVVEGNVGGDVSAAAGSLVVREGASVGGNVEAAAGDARVNGRVDGSARLAGETVTLGPAAVVGGDVEYDAESFTAASGARVSGSVTRNDDLSVGAVGVPWAGEFRTPGGFAVPAGAFAAWGLVVNLLVGALLVALAPRFAREVTDRGTQAAVKSGGVGLLTFVAVPIALALVAITIVGIPVSVVGAVAYGLVLWLTTIYGALVVGAWLLSLVGRESVWWALAVGLSGFTLVGFVPYVGELLQFAVLLVGLGAFVLAVRDRRAGGDQDATSPPGEDENGPSEGAPAA